MAFPIASGPALESEAVSDTRISGADVPKETIVKPIISGEMPRFLAIDAAPATSRFALQMRAIKPKRIDAAASSISANFLLKYASVSALELLEHIRCQKRAMTVNDVILDIVQFLF
jgi:hypothetical protein